MKLIDLQDRVRAASDLDTNLVVTAGAGTGKTSLVVERLLHRILERNTPIEKIAAITFTRKAAAELRERLEDALERVSQLFSEAGKPSTEGTSLDAGNESDRVFERLYSQHSDDHSAKESFREDALRRARAALESLDDAPIGTIHGMAGDLLRRHHEAAGVDSGYQVDEDGSAFDEIFGEHWQAFLEDDTNRAEESEDPEHAERWSRVLERISLSDLRALAARLVGFGIPLAAIRSETRDVQVRHLAEIAQDLASELGWIRERVLPIEGVNKKLEGSVETAETLVGELAEGSLTEARIKNLKLPKTPTLGKRAEVEPDEAKRLEKRLQRAFVRLHAAARLDTTIGDELTSIIERFVSDFRREFLRRGYVSNDALIVLCRDVLRDHPEVRRAESERFEHILVDEFQDTDPAQYEIVFFLAEDPEAKAAPASDAFSASLIPGKIFIVGDAKQSIYRFRGADIDAYRRAVAAVEREGGAVLTLRANFRSVPNLVEPLNRLFDTYFDGASDSSVALDPSFDPLEAQRPAREQAAIRVWSVGERNEVADVRRRTEAEITAAWIRERIDAGSLRPRDVAILLRSMTGVDPLLRSLRRWGVPYLVESGRGFYTRFEVELFLALLRVVVSPADPIPLLACLRSPLGAVPDRELHLHALAVPERDRRWRLDAEVSQSDCPRLWAALASLRDFVERHRDAPLDVVARAILEETPLRVSFAASHEGAQKLANLEKVVRTIIELSWDGQHSPEQIIARIELEEGRTRGEGDSPLSDESLDAVGVLSMHASKGLEWPVVILPDLMRSQKTGNGGVELHLAAPIGDASTCQAKNGRPGDFGLSLRVSKELQTPAALRRSALEEAHERAENKRLFYVATTRARDELVFVVGSPGRGEHPWIEPLEHWGYEIRRNAFPESESFLGGAVLHERIERPPKLKSSRAAETDAAIFSSAATRFLSARDRFIARLGESPTVCAISGDRRAPESDTTEGTSPSSGTGARRDRRIARAAGSAIHHLLEVWDRADKTWLFETAGKASVIAAAREQVDAGVVLGDVEARLRDADASGALDEIAKLPSLAREVPLLWQDDDGTIWDGVADLITGTPGAPEIVDYKTTAEKSTDELEQENARQLARYREGVRRALRLREGTPARILKLGPKQET